MYSLFEELLKIILLYLHPTDDIDGKEGFIYGYDNMVAFALITIFFLILVVFAVLDT